MSLGLNRTRERKFRQDKKVLEGKISRGLELGEASDWIQPLAGHSSSRRSLNECRASVT